MANQYGTCEKNKTKIKTSTRPGRSSVKNLVTTFKPMSPSPVAQTLAGLKFLRAQPPSQHLP